MKVKAVPLKFDSVIMEDYNAQLNSIAEMFSEEVEFLPTIRVGENIPKEAQAVVFPILVGEAYQKLDILKKINLPIIIITSEYGTMAMWDWEILTIFKEQGMNVYAPYNKNLAKVIFRTISLKKQMKSAKFLVWQDAPGNGMQADIFKRFFWWEKECSRRIKNKFGIDIIIKSYKELNEKAKAISDDIARVEVLNHNVNATNISTEKPILSAYKLYLAIKDEIDNEKNVVGVGCNCLNESFLSDTTPCLAWNLLYKERGLVWSCEADTMSLLTQYIIDKTIHVPVMTTNIYPFLVGMAALSHEKITEFPDVTNPDDHALLVHCGYFGFLPESMATKWEMKEKVLEIVDDNAHVIDAEMGLGNMTLAKIHSNFNSLFVCSAELEEYVKYPGSDCRNGGLLKVANGHDMVDKLYSHHISVIKGDKMAELAVVCRLLDIKLDKC